MKRRRRMSRREEMQGEEEGSEGSVEGEAVCRLHVRGEGKTVCSYQPHSLSDRQSDMSVNETRHPIRKRHSSI